MIVPAGQRECKDCLLHHPDRIRRPCSAYGKCQNQNKDCSMHMARPKNALTVEEFVRRRLAGQAVQ